MAVRKKRAKQAKAANGAENEAAAEAPRGGGKRLQRSDEEKIQLVRQVMASENQSAEIKRLGIYPNQFYDWKKKFAEQLGAPASAAPTRRRSDTVDQARTVADEAKAFIQGKAALLERLRAQRAELDELITQLES